MIQRLLMNSILAHIGPDREPDDKLYIVTFDRLCRVRKVESFEYLGGIGGALMAFSLEVERSLAQATAGYLVRTAYVNGTYHPVILGHIDLTY